jgi:hypothetical protein
VGERTSPDFVMAVKASRYLTHIPTILDMPPMRLAVLEYPDPHAPYGLRGVGEPPTISSTPAIVAAIRAATGRPLPRVPVRPEHITGSSAVRAGVATPVAGGVRPV